MRQVLIAVLALFGATANADELTLAGGYAEFLPGSETMVRVAAVQDARCPAAADCVWEGTIRVTLELAVPGDPPEIYDLCNSCDGAAPSADVGGYILTLVRLEPGREVLDLVSRLPVVQDYTVILLVTPK